MEIPVQRLHPDAVVPDYAHEGDAGCDLVAVEGVRLAARGGRALVATGLSMASWCRARGWPRATV